MTCWRLISDAESHGAWNMGADEALLASAVSLGRPALRFYRWQGPWLSVGYGQRADGQRRLDCQRAGVGWVRRLTGGRAVLHGADLTYAIAARETDLPKGLMASYELAAGALLDALHGLGVEAIASGGTAGRPGDRNLFDCFARTARREICVEGRKLAGSAQRRANGGVLQHGSIRLRPDPEIAQRATSLTGEGATSLAELGARFCDPATVEKACVEAFGKALGADFEASELTQDELAWTRRRVDEHRHDPDHAPSGVLRGASRELFGSR